MTARRATTRCLAVGATLLAALALPPPGAAAQAKIEATLASPNAVTFLIVRAESMFAAKVAELTNGGLTIKVVTDGQLGGQKENIEAVLVLLRHSFCSTLLICGRPQQGHRGRTSTSVRARRIRSVAMEFGMWRCDRSGRSSVSVTGGKGRLPASPGAGRS